MDTEVTHAVMYAVASAIGFALSTSLQHRAVGNAPEGGLWRLVRFLATHPLWLLGAGIGFVTLVFHALALNNGSLALVQPIMVSAVVLAVVVRAALDRLWPPRDELVAVIMTTFGLGVFLVIADPKAENVSDDRQALILWLTGVAMVAMLVLLAHQTGQPRSASFLLGVSSGVCFGLTAGLLKMLSHDFGSAGVGGVTGSWHFYAQVVTGVAGIAINQRAYQLAPLAVSMPVLNVVDVLIALIFGVLVFDEFPTEGPLGSTILVLSLAMMGWGLRNLANDQLDSHSGVAERPGSRG